MGNGNRTTVDVGVGGRDDGGDVQSVTCDVGLGLNTQPFSYPCKNMNFVSNSSPYNHNQIASGISSESTSDGVMGVSGKVLFTAIQWQELERQTMIYKYIMASIPVPPQLLLPLSTQSNRVSTGLRFSNGSDPEPWRCRRTDGKKWRCAKDVAPDQKYCERHAHKTRTRSRKPVEIQSHNTKDNPSMISTANKQTNEWFMKNGANNQFQQSMQSPSGNPYPNTTTGTNTNSNSNAAVSARRQDFIDSWSRIGSGGDDCSLTLSMQSGGNGVEFDHESFEMAVGLLNGDREVCGDVFKPHHEWLDQGSWAGLGSTPGGPLGEALCLGITSTQNEPSPDHGYSNSSFEGGGDHGLG